MSMSMSHMIYKYPLVGPSAILMIPKDAQILAVQVQHGTPCVWVRVDTEAELEERAFYIVGTGEKMPSDERLVHIATFQQDGGRYVGHVFEYRRRH